MYYDDIFLQNGFIDMLCKISNQFVERLDVLSFDDVRPLILFHEKYVLSDWNKANSSILSVCHWYFFLLPERQSGGRGGGGGAERIFITGAGTIREMGTIRGSIIICGAAVVCGSAIICSVGIVCSAAFIKWRDIHLVCGLATVCGVEFVSGAAFVL